MKQLENETYEQFQLRRKVENDETDTKLSWRLRWNSRDKGTYVKTMPPIVERPKRTPKRKEIARKRKSGAEKRRAKRGLAFGAMEEK